MSLRLFAFARRDELALAARLAPRDALIVAPADAAAAADVGGPEVFVALPAIDDPAHREALATGLATGLAARPEGIVLLGAREAADVVVLDARLAVAEARLGLPHGSTCIVALAGGSARGVLALPGFVAAGPRLLGLAFDRAGLDRDLAALDTAAVRAHASAGMLLAARAAGVMAIEALADEGEEVAEALAAERRGHAGVLARGPAQALAIAEALRR